MFSIAELGMVGNMNLVYNYFILDIHTWLMINFDITKYSFYAVE